MAESEFVQQLFTAHRLLGAGRVAESYALLRELETRLGDGPSGDERFMLYRLLGQAARTQGDLPMAEANYRKALEVAEALGDDAQRSGALEGLALTASRDDRPEDAAALLREAAECALRAGDHRGYASVLQNYAHILLDAGLEGATAAFRRALEVPHLPDHQRSIILDNLARSLARDGDLGESVALSKQAIEGFDALGAVQDAFIARVNLANTYRSMGDVAAAATAFEAAHDLAVAMHGQIDAAHYDRLPERVRAIEQQTRVHLQSTPDKTGLPVALRIGIGAKIAGDLTEKGEREFEAGNLAEAEILLRQAESHWEHLRATHCLLRVWNALGAVYMEAGFHERAFEVLTRSSRIAHALGDAMRECLALANLAALSARSSVNCEDTLTLYIRSRALDAWLTARAKAGRPGPTHLIAAGGAEIALADICARYSAWRLACDYAQQSVDVAALAADYAPHRLAARLGRQAEIQERAGDKEGLQATIQRLMELAEAAPNRQTVFVANAALGVASYAAGDRGPSTLNRLVLACDAYEDLRRGAVEMGALSAHGSLAGPPFAEAAQVALDTGRPGLAFSLLERNKSRSLLDATRHFRQDHGDMRLAAEEDLWRRQRQLRRSLHATEPAMPEGSSFRALHRAKEELDEVMAELRALWQDLEPDFPGLRSHRMAEPATDAEVAQLLSAEGSGMLVAFWISDSGVYAFLIGGRRAALSVSELRLEDDGDWNAYFDLLEQLAAAKRPDDREALLMRILHSSAHALLRSTIESAAGEAGCVVVVPHAVLHLAPLHLRSTEPRVSAPHVRFLPSSSLLRVTRTVSWNQNHDVIVGGDPTGDLLFSRGECAEVARRFGGAPVLGSDMTAAWLEEALRATRPRLVHLACHGVFDERRPSRSGLVLAADAAEGGGTGAGRVVTADRLGEFNWSGALVVLSACSSGKHGVRRGDELSGLSQALVAAGARGLVVSTWPIPDFETSLLMSFFYELLEKHPVWDTSLVSEALGSAQRRLSRITARELVQRVVQGMREARGTSCLSQADTFSLLRAHLAAGNATEARRMRGSDGEENAGIVDSDTLNSLIEDSRYDTCAFPAVPTWGGFVFIGA